MRTRASVKPSKPMSAMALAIALGMGLFGLAMLPAFGMFGLLWLLTLLGIAGYHAMNLLSDDGVATEVVDIDSPSGTAAGLGASSPSGSASAGQSPEERLARLDGLRRQGLITEQEYADQRRRILESL